MSDQQIIERFLVTQLDGLGEVYTGAIPEGVSYPALLVRFALAEDVMAQGQRQLVAAEYQVVARATGWAFPFALQSAIDERLHGARDVVAGFSLSCERLGPHTHVDRIGETPIRDAGGRYRVWLAWPSP